MNYTVSTFRPMPWLWSVTRDEDGRLMNTGSLFECLRWVKAWGDVDLGR
jgi:hypothetical protein